MELSIVTLTRNHRDYIQSLYVSLCDHSHGLTWEWLVGDSGDDNTASYLESLDDSRVRHFRVRTASYGDINNELAKRARGAALLFLNNDTRVLEGWWQEPLALLRLPHIAIVGSILYNEDGSIQSAGMGVCPQAPHSYNFVTVPRWPEGQRPAVIVPAVTGACLFCKPSVFEALGGFDTAYGGGYYEDTDLCLRAYASGSMVLVSLPSRVVHKARGSLDVSRAYWHCIPRNRQFFRNRWRLVLHRLEAVGQLPLRPERSEIAVCIDPWLSVLGGGECEFTWAVNFLSRYCDGVTVCTGGSSKELQPEVAERFGEAFPSGVVVRCDLRVQHAATIVWDQTYYNLTTNYSSKSRIHLKRVMFGPTRTPLAQGPYFMFNSEYTRASLRSTREGSVIYPPVEQHGLSCETMKGARNRARIVIAVGRFASRRRFLNWKNQEALIRFFHAWHEGLDFKLVLVGNVNDAEYLQRCTMLAASGTAAHRIVFRAGITATELHTWLNDSMFFVSFAGYQRVTAAQAEHFGIALVEAMAAGCVCLAYAAGGHLEIIDDGVDGFLWKTEAQLAQLLTFLATDERASIRETVMLRARQKAVQFAPMFAEVQVRRILHQRSSSGQSTVRCAQ